MIPFKLFFENATETTYISPRTIYNFYFLYTYYQTRGLDQFSEFLIQEFAKNIKQLYLNVFTKLLTKQLSKYQGRGRIDPDFNMVSSGNPTQLRDLMAKTFRSDMKRRNDRWVDLANWVVKLNETNSIKDILFIVDRINNTTHNTAEIILSKFENAGELMRVFDNCHNFQSLDQFRPYINKEYVKLL
jgi:hypothetical protein